MKKEKRIKSLRKKEEEQVKILEKIRKEIIELSIMENCFCPECGSRIYTDYDKVRCTKENGKCNYDSLYRWITKP